MIFGTFCLAALVHVFLLFQETCGKTLEEMDTIFDNLDNLWAFKSRHHDDLGLDRRAEEAKKDIEKEGDLGDREGDVDGGKAGFVETESTQSKAARA